MKNPVVNEVHPAGFLTHQGLFEDPYLVFHIVSPQGTHPKVTTENDQSKRKYQFLAKMLKVV